MVKLRNPLAISNGWGFGSEYWVIVGCDRGGLPRSARNDGCFGIEYWVLSKEMLVD